MRTCGSRLATKAPPRLKPAPKVRADHYGTPEHRAWAAAVVGRANGVCEGCGATGKRLIADHIKELQDGGALLDLRNGQALCGSCHTRKTASERAKRAHGADVPASNHPDWLRPSVIPLYIVCGPPASGKTTFVRERARARDLVIDLDDIAARLSGQPAHEWDKSWLNEAVRERNNLLGKLSRSEAWRWSAAWLIVGEPRAKRRQWWTDALMPCRVYVLETPDETCCQRITARGGDTAGQSAAVYRWWADYERREGDEIVRQG